MNVVEIKEFLGYGVTIDIEGKYVTYELDSSEFYDNYYPNTVRGNIMKAVNCETLKVVRNAFIELIKAYYKAEVDNGIVKVIEPDNGETVTVYIL